MEGIESYISVVKNGYLGEYTDTTIGDFLDGWYGIYYDETGWDGGTTDDGKIIVEFQAEAKEYLEPVHIQFTMYDKQVFKVSGYDDGSGKKFESAEVAAELNYTYYCAGTLSVDEAKRDEALQDVLSRFDSIAGSSVLYGASADYSGDRSKLGEEFYNESPLKLNVRELINYYYDDIFEYDNVFYDISEEMEEEYKYEAEETVEVDENAEYLLPDSDTEYLSKEDLYGFTAEECRIARNEIYARHGRIFKDEELQSYFEQFDWYSPEYDADNFDESILNEYEMANRDLIIEYEKDMKYR